MLTGKWKVKDVSLNELFRCVLLLVEIAITEYRTQISGVDVIFDLEGLTIQHVYQVGPSFASSILHWAQVCKWFDGSSFSARFFFSETFPAKHVYLLWEDSIWD
jgi:hypothetical protein